MKRVSSLPPSPNSSFCCLLVGFVMSLFTSISIAAELDTQKSAIKPVTPASFPLVIDNGKTWDIRGVAVVEKSMNEAIEYAKISALSTLSMVTGIETVLKSTVNHSDIGKVVGPFDEFLSDDIENDERKLFLRDVPALSSPIPIGRGKNRGTVLLIRSLDTDRYIDRVSVSETSIGATKYVVATMTITRDEIMRMRDQFRSRYEKKRKILENR